MKKPVIICVDDERIVLDTLWDQIQNALGEECTCEMAEGGDDGLALIDEMLEDGYQIAVVISDHNMPGMKGDEFLIAVHQKIPDTCKILLTGEASLSAVLNAITNARLYRYVQKPWEENDLMLTISEAFKSYVNQYQLLEYNRLLRVLNENIQAISAEIDTQVLTQKLAAATLQTIGGEQAYLVLNNESGLKVYAHAVLDPKKQLELLPINHEQPELYQPIIKSVTEFAQQPSSDKSDYRMIAPITKSGQKIGYLYTEYTKTREKFNKYHQDVLQMLASQGSVSLVNANLFQEIKEYNIVIEQKNKDITDSIVYARRIQNSILPSIENLYEIFPDSFVLHKAKDVVSGDFYWFTQQGDHFLIASVDCTGHGVPGAFVSLLAYSMINTIVNEFPGHEPGVILTELATRVPVMLGKEHGNVVNRDGMDLALCSFNLKKKTMSFAGARRPLLYIRDGVMKEIPGSKISIGEDFSVDYPRKFETFKIDLRPGDIYYIFSDGVVDQFGGPENKKFSSRRLRQAIQNCHTSKMNEQLLVLYQTLDNWQGSTEQTDDMVLIGLRYTGVEQPAPH